jgi:Holin of 3TMs, for gene-transfer release
MGVIGRILGAGAMKGVGAAVEAVAGVRGAREATVAAAIGAYGAEFAGAGGGRFDGFVDGLNRLPRPLLALSTLGLFGYAMAAPAGFGTRMQSLALVPEPLWWLLGAVVSFYFGARELHHQRTRSALTLAAPGPAAAAPAPPAALAAPMVPAAIDPEHNAAVEEWRRSRA